MSEFQLKISSPSLDDPPSRSVRDRLGAKVESPKKKETREHSPRTSRPCKYYIEGHCNKGNKCNFTHETSGRNYVQIDEDDDDEENFDDYTPTDLDPVPIPENRSFVVREDGDDDIQEI